MYKRLRQAAHIAYHYLERKENIEMSVNERS